MSASFLSAWTTSRAAKIESLTKYIFLACDKSEEIYSGNASNPKGAHLYLVLFSRDATTKIVDPLIQTIVWSTLYGLKQKAEELMSKIYKDNKDYSIHTGWILVQNDDKTAAAESMVETESPSAFGEGIRTAFF